MKSKKLIKKQLREKQIAEDKTLRKYMIIGFSLLILVVISVNVFYVFWCDVKYNYRISTLFGNEVPANLICMHENKLEYHEGIMVELNDYTFYTCSEHCKKSIINNYEEEAFIEDAFSGDTICKAGALIGLKERGKPRVIYFKNIQNFKKYYATKP